MNAGRDKSVLVVTVRDAATRLGITTSEVEAMVAQGTVKSLVAGWTTFIPSSEVQRLQAASPEIGAG